MKATFFRIHDLVTLQINGAGGRVHAFFNDELSFFKAPAVEGAEIRVVVGPLPQLTGARRLFDNRTYTVLDDTIAFAKRYKGFRMRLRMSGLQHAETTVHFNGHPLTYRLLFLKYLVPILRLRLLQQGCTLVKASAIGRGGRVWLIPSWSGGGKTSLVLHALQQGFLYWSDTFTLISRHGRVYPFPRPLHVFWRNVQACPPLWRQLASKDRLALRLKQAANALSLRALNLSHRLPIRGDSIGSSPARLRSALFLVQTDGPDREDLALSTTQAVSRTVANDRHETRLFDAAYWPYVRNQPSTGDYWQTHSEIITRALEGVESREILLSQRSQVADYERIIEDHMV